MKKWNFCGDNHEYAQYHSYLLDRTVCFTCDPESNNNRHRPDAQKVISAALKNHPVYFLDDEGFIIPFKAADSERDYTCPHCKSAIRWYQAGPESLRWVCDCPPASVLGRKGGQSRSPAKIAAVRENAKKGGRPRKAA